MSDLDSMNFGFFRAITSKNTHSLSFYFRAQKAVVSSFLTAF